MCLTYLQAVFLLSKEITCGGYLIVLWYSGVESDTNTLSWVEYSALTGVLLCRASEGSTSADFNYTL